jgi:hypothetical protein
MARILGRSEHVLNLRLLGIKREPVCKTSFWIIEFQRQLVELIPSIDCVLLAPVSQFVHFGGGHGLKFWAICRFWCNTSIPSMPVMVVATGRLIAYAKLLQPYVRQP